MAEFPPSAPPAVKVRPWQPADLPAIARLYHDTVHHINCRDYSPEQIAAWSLEVQPVTYWRDRFATRRAWVAMIGGVVAGFAELEPPGDVDCFYVHHQHQRRGVGRALMNALIESARQSGATEMGADVSLTARLFFEALGFRVIHRQRREYRGQHFEQFRMVRLL